MLVIFLREPLFFLEPRLWAEEGTRYYSYAYHYSQGRLWYKGLLNVQLGYFSLWPNVASTIAANLIPIEQVPLVTTLMAFLIQLIPLGLIIWSNADFWASPLRKSVGVLIYLLTPVSAGIWLNTINSQFYLAFVTILILLEPAENHLPRKWVYRFLLVVGGLTGPLSSLLVPMYALVAWLDRDRERAVQAITLGVCAVIQVGLLVYHSGSDQSIGVRLADGRIYLLLFSLWTQSIGLLLSGFSWMGEFASWIITEHRAGSITLVAVWVGLLLLTIAIFWWLTNRLPLRERVIFLGGYGLALGVSYVGALASSKIDLIIPGHGARYFWLPNILFGLLLTANIFSKIDGAPRRWLCTISLATILVLGLVNYRTTLIANWEWPQWRAKVAQWRVDPEYRIRIWPSGWTITLKEK
jgi:hypothetical protein